MRPFQARRADIECFAHDLETRGRARATRRLCTIAGFYKYAVEEDLLDHSPAAHVRRPRLDYESPATGLDRNELGALLVAAGLGSPGEHALVSLLALNWLRVSEATGANIENLGVERGHRTLVITRKGGKVVTIPNQMTGTTCHRSLSREARLMGAPAVVPILVLRHRQVYDPAVDQGTPRPEPGPGEGQGPGPRRPGARVGRARRRAVVVGGVAALGLVAGVWAVLGWPGGHRAGHTHAGAVAVPPRRHSHGRVVRLVVSASGDLLIHAQVFQRALVDGGGRRYNFAPMLARIRPYIRGADLAVCQVETPMSGPPFTGYPVFNTPPALATAIRRTGWEACSTAGTHTLDQGQRGVVGTIRALNRAHVAHTGSFTSAAAQKTPLIMTIKGVRVAFLAYTALTNGIPSPHPWSVNRASAARILSGARRARRDGAQAVIVNLHWGDEYLAQPSSFQLQLARRLTRSPAITAIVGQHVHVVQPIRFIHGKPVVFGEGNLISDQIGPCCPAASQDGMIVLLTIDVGAQGARVRFIHYVPIWVHPHDFLVLPAGTAWRTDHADAAALRASYRRTVAAVGRTPRIQPIPAHLR